MTRVSPQSIDDAVITGEGNDRRPVSGRYASLDIWRGLACLMVVILHAGHHAKQHLSPSDSGGAEQAGVFLLILIGRLGVGVQLFFVISGYCIAASADSARRKGLSAGNFFGRRFRRIFPPYWFALVLIIGVSVVDQTCFQEPRLTIATPEVALVPPVADLSVWQWVGNLTLTETWRWHFIGGPEQKLLGPAWTLCYEEQFYAVCGLLLLMVPRRFFVGVVAVTFATLLIVLGSLIVGVELPRGLFFDGRWVLFAAGVGVYWQLNRAPNRWERAIPLTLFTAMLVSICLRYVILRHSPDWWSRQLMFEWVIGTGFALLLLALYRWDSHITETSVLRPVAYCGQMCYSLYLIHWPITLLVGIGLYDSGVRGAWPTLLITIPVATALALFGSWLFFRKVESRFLNTTLQLSRKHSRDRCGSTNSDLVSDKDVMRPVSSGV